MHISIQINDKIERDEVLTLYFANGWSSAKKPDQLMAALTNSHMLVTARESGALVGLANAISDGHLVVYYPHMLVLPQFHRKGIGTLLMRTLQEKYAGFHQQMLTADGRAVEFYEAMGFQYAGKTRAMWIYGGNDH